MQYRRAHSHSKQSGVDFFRKSKCDFLRMNCFGQSALGFQNKNITFRLVAPFPPVLTTAILFPRTSTNTENRYVHTKWFHVHWILRRRQKWLADLRRRREKILGFWGSISKIQSRIWDLRTESGMGHGTRWIPRLARNSQYFSCLATRKQVPNDRISWNSCFGSKERSLEKNFAENSARTQPPFSPIQLSLASWGMGASNPDREWLDTVLKVSTKIRRVIRKLLVMPFGHDLSTCLVRIWRVILTLRFFSTCFGTENHQNLFFGTRSTLFLTTEQKIRGFERAIFES